MCDVGYLCANFSLPRPLCSRVTPDVHDRETSDKSIALWGWRYNSTHLTYLQCPVDSNCKL